MSKKQLVWLFLNSLGYWTMGNGLTQLLPVYATKLGANSAVAGYYLAVSFLALVIGSLSAGWISDALGRRKLPLILSGLAAVPCFWLLSQAKALWDLTVLTALAWFLGGLSLALLRILTGLSVGKDERGKVFGIVAVSAPLGALIGGLGVGWLVARWGYAAMFNVVAVFSVLQPLCSLPLEEKDTRKRQAADVPHQKLPGLGGAFHWLFASSIVAAVAGYAVTLVRPLLMSDRGFGPLDINSVAAVAGLVALPLPMLMGWLSDRAGRKLLLEVGYLAGFASMVAFAFSTTLWNFWLMAALATVGSQANAAVGSAMVADLVPRQSLAKGMALFVAANWIGGVLGFAAGGYMFHSLGFGLTLIAGGCLTLASIALLLPVGAGPQERGQPSAVST